MKKLTGANLSRLLAILGGLLWVAFHAGLVAAHTGSPDNTRFIAIPALASAFFAVALSSLYRSGRLRAASRWGTLVSITGLGLFTVGALIVAFFWNGAWLIAILAEMVISLGLILFSFAALAEKILVRFNGLPLLMTFAYLPSWMATPPSPPFPAFFEHWLAALYGAGWIVMGIFLPRRELINDEENGQSRDIHSGDAKSQPEG